MKIGDAIEKDEKKYRVIEIISDGDMIFVKAKSEESLLKEKEKLESLLQDLTPKPPTK